MKITERKIKISELMKGYIDNGDNSDEGVFAYDGKLTVRPAYQRNFVYNDKQRDAVINSIRKEYPLNVMYWAKTGEDTYEVLDGQQRTISIGRYVSKEYSIDHRYFQNLTAGEQQQILDYELTIYVCEGTDAEKLAWFEVINVAGEVLTKQELLNATYTGPWLFDAKRYFSKRNCVAAQKSDGYMKGNPNRQEYLEKVLAWIAEKDGLVNGQEYMAKHQDDKDAEALWTYFQEVIDWASRLFKKRPKLTNNQEWGLLYNKYHDKTYSPKQLETEIQALLMDDEVTNQKGIIPYVLSDKKPEDEKHLSLRAFTDPQKLRAYEAQKHQCPMCVKNGVLDEYDIGDMQADHITPWSKGGRTTDDNLQMLCRKCNSSKSDK